VTVDGSPAAVRLVWTQVVYTITFLEQGLPSSTNWSVTWNGTTTWSETTTLVFTGPNGTYLYEIGQVVHWSTSPYSGNVTVNGQDVTIFVNWTRPSYTLTFTETGLPSGTEWSVTVDGKTYNLTSNSLALSLPNGNYSYTIAKIPGWTTPSYTGRVTIDDAAQTVTVPWTQVTYPLTFEETGLPTGQRWAVTVDGMTYDANSTSIVLSVPNATYSFRLEAVPGWITTHWTGSVTVDGASASVNVVWTAAEYPVAFTETGLPTGTGWSVNCNGISVSGVNSTHLFNETNGTCAYTVGSVTGFIASPDSGSVTVAGSPISVTITFTPTTSPPSPGTPPSHATPTFLGLPVLEGYALLAGLVLLVVGVVGVAAWKMRSTNERKRPPPEPWTP
jgi:hypothetical protein